MSLLDEDWVVEDDYEFDEGQDDCYEENLHEYLTRLDAPDREVLVEHLSEPIFINVPRVVNSVNSVDAIVPVLGEQDIPGGDPFSGLFSGTQKQAKFMFFLQKQSHLGSFCGSGFGVFFRTIFIFLFFGFSNASDNLKQISA